MAEKPLACTIEAPCKINLHLRVAEKRPDGFHNLESIFACLDFSDTLRFECAGKDGDCSIEMTWEPSEIAPQEMFSIEKNLVFKAVSLFRERSGFNQGLHIHLKKRIPMGAGLGGGSSDAASTLLAMNFLAVQSSGAALSKKELLEMAALLGSDVPFFLNGGTAWVSGRGEIIEPVKTPEGLYVVLAKPSFSSDTASAFKLLDEYREKNSELNFVSSVRNSYPDQNPETWPFVNDFLPVFLELDEFHGSIYKALLDELYSLGASFAGLSGSGSCCFGIFKDRQPAENAEKEIKSLKNNQISTKLTFILALSAIPVLE